MTSVDVLLLQVSLRVILRSILPISTVFPNQSVELGWFGWRPRRFLYERHDNGPDLTRSLAQWPRTLHLPNQTLAAARRLDRAHYSRHNRSAKEASSRVLSDNRHQSTTRNNLLTFSGIILRSQRHDRHAIVHLVYVARYTCGTICRDHD